MSNFLSRYFTSCTLVFHMFREICGAMSLLLLVVISIVFYDFVFLELSLYASSYFIY